MDQDPEAGQDEDGSDDEGYTQAVSLDERLRGLPQTDDQITSTSVNLSQAQPRRKLVRRAVNAASPVISAPSPVVAYHTPQPVIPYATNPRRLVRRTHVLIPAVSSPDPRSSPTPIPSKRPFSEVDGGRDERDDPSDDEDINGVPALVMRAADLPPVRRRIFDDAVHHMRLMVISEAPYGDSIQIDKMAVAAWFTSLKNLHETHGYLGSTPPMPGEIALLKARMHQVKGDIKTACRDIVISKKGYDFRQDDSPESIAHNRKLVTALVTGNSFLYKDPARRDLPGTLWENSAPQEVLNRTFYNDGANSEAVLIPKFFANGLPLPAGAFIATTLECVIMEYQTGTRVKTRMSAKTWQPKYEKHLKILTDWKVYTTNSGSQLTQKLQLRMIQAARKYAKVDVTPAAGTEALGMSTIDFENNDA
ncbi:hypothetical protein B0H15DRAFT_603918 [Mycena belliarum]|uniref:DUF6532 domain-containing protein n=1 Tax=Mycena belliarum TaxID=1033014 RepID=A0AAD6TS67_9AGAR|nr:hypothetical protein B0H15DRAFT_603918 [Mycena belliae]